MIKVRIVPAIGGGPAVELDVAENETIGSVKERVCGMKRLPPNFVHLVFRGNRYRDDQTLKEIGVGDLDKLTLITRTTGGG